MKNVIMCALLLSSFGLWADDTSGAVSQSKVPSVDEIIANPEHYKDDPRVRHYLDQANSTLNLGSEEEMAAIVKKTSPALVKKVIAAIGSSTPEQSAQIEKIAIENSDELVLFSITGIRPKNFLNEAEKIYPKLKDVSEKEKDEMFSEVRKEVNKTLFESMVKLDAQLGYLYGDTNKGIIAQLNSRLLNLRKITIGDITIENVHAEAQVGYPQNGALLLTGTVSLDNTNWSFDGELLGLSYDIREKALNFNILKAKANYDIFPWLKGYAGFGIGVRSYTDGTVFSVDPTIGVKAQKQYGKVNVSGLTELQYQTGEQSLVVSCGASANFDIIDKDKVKLQAGILTQLNAQTNPKPNVNSVEWINTAGITGSF